MVNYGLIEHQGKDDYMEGEEFVPMAEFKASMHKLRAQLFQEFGIAECPGFEEVNFNFKQQRKLVKYEMEKYFQMDGRTL